MKLNVSFNVVEPYVKRFLPDQPYAPAWCTMWLEQHTIDDPSYQQMQDAISAYKARVAR